METTTYKHYITVIFLLILTSLALAFTVDVKLEPEAGINVYLADRVGPWTGEEVLYCQNPECQKSFLISELQDLHTCPVCTSKLSNMTFAEKSILPADTILLRKHYGDGLGDFLSASIVLSSKDRSSIHRPQVCLVGQGNEVLSRQVITVPVEGRAPLKVMVLDLLWKGRNQNDQPVAKPTYYAYWFVAKGHETPYHLERMFWMAADRIFFNKADRWAYIAVAGTRDEAGAYKKQIESFIAQLYPPMILN